MGQASRKIPLASRRADGFLARQFESQGDDAPHLVEHARGIGAGLHNVYLAAIQLDTRVFCVHAADGWYLQLRLHGGAEGTARHAVTPRLERGTCHHEVWVLRGDEVQEFRYCRLSMLGDVVIAAEHCRHHCTGFTQHLLDRTCGSHSSREQPWPHPGFLLTAELAEKLVQITDHSECWHRSSPSP